MPQLTWDLHLHPAPSVTPRWGDGLRVWEAAREAGVRGFVWKSHEEHTAARCSALPTGPPDAIGSASLNAFASPKSVMDAVAQGARWIWGPSRDSAGGLAWDLSLPPWWPELRSELVRLKKPLVLATSHLGVAGRLELARTAAEMGAYCSVTHSLYLSDQDARVLAGLGCAFELDLYTAAHPIADRPQADLLTRAASLRETGSLVYFTSDAGQAHVGNPFEFSRKLLDALASEGNSSLIAELAGTNPATFVGQVWP
ncbi:MAG: DUF6282 family protein [Candidatus Dormibacteraeota bacterium]|nr:DUF6282 family protein [Candidatus Dormibacteraeota bacterium]